jgi:hypothetical protein
VARETESNTWSTATRLGKNINPLSLSVPPLSRNPPHARSRCAAMCACLSVCLCVCEIQSAVHFYMPPSSITRGTHLSSDSFVCYESDTAPSCDQAQQICKSYLRRTTTQISIHRWISCCYRNPWALLWWMHGQAFNPQIDTTTMQVLQ